MSQTDLIAMVQSWTIIELTMTYIGITQVDGKICIWVFEGFQKYEDPDETGPEPEPFFDSMEVYYPEEQKLIVYISKFQKCFWTWPRPQK